VLDPTVHDVDFSISTGNIPIKNKRTEITPVVNNPDEDIKFVDEFGRVTTGHLQSYTASQGEYKVAAIDFEGLLPGAKKGSKEAVTFTPHFMYDPKTKTF